MPQLVAFLETRPTVLKRSTARSVLDTLPATALADAIIDRLDALTDADLATMIPRATALVELVKDREEARAPVAEHLLARFPGLVAKQAGKEARALARKAGLTPA